MAATVAAAMAVAPLADEPALEGLVRLIDDKHMLVVLDNFEHVLAAADMVSELIEACEGLRILITSREPLRLSGEQLFVVGPLALPAPEERFSPVSILRSPAIRLFVERCRDRDVGFALDDANAASVAEICARLDGMPLAIELAAAHAALLAPEEIIGRLDDALTVLVGGPRDAPPRQQTLRATLDWSHALLDHQEQQAFAGLAVFSGGCTLEAAETVLGIDLRAVETLLTKSLLVRHTQDDGEPRVRMLEPVRAYAVERFMERPDAEDLRRRHCEYYVGLAERSEPALRGPDQMTWLHRLGADHANLRAAVLWSLRAEQPELGLRLASALGIHAGGLHSEIPGWLEATLKAASDAEPPLRAKALLALGLLIGGGPAPAEHLHEALRLFRAESDAHGAAQALIALSIDTDQAGDRDLAAQLAGEALELAGQPKTSGSSPPRWGHRFWDRPRASDTQGTSGNRAWRWCAAAGIESTCLSHSATSVSPRWQPATTPPPRQPSRRRSRSPRRSKTRGFSPSARSTEAFCTFSRAQTAWQPATSPEPSRCAANRDSRCP